RMWRSSSLIAPWDVIIISADGGSVWLVSETRQAGAEDKLLSGVIARPYNQHSITVSAHASPNISLSNNRSTATRNVTSIRDCHDRVRKTKTASFSRSGEWWFLSLTSPSREGAHVEGSVARRKDSIRIDRLSR